MAVFVAANLFGGARLEERPRRERALFGMIAVSVAIMPLAFVAHTLTEQRVIRERMDPYTMASAAGAARALVLIHGRVGSMRSMAAEDLTRNGIDYDAGVLYGLDPGEGGRCGIADRFSDRVAFLSTLASRQGARRADAAGVPVGQGRLRV